jgi:hypothetical protein
MSIFVVGGMPGQEDMLLQAFAQTYPGLQVSIFCPSMQFTPDGSEADTAIDLIQQAQPNIVFICLGMPKQEYFAFRYRREQTTLNAPLLLCVGAAMEFALGQKKRAPLWMQKSAWNGSGVSPANRAACGSVTQRKAQNISASCYANAAHSKRCDASPEQTSQKKKDRAS